METGGQPGRELVFRPNHYGEQLLLAAAILSREYRRALVGRHPPDRFLVDQHRAIMAALREADRRGLESDPATLNRLGGGRLDISYLAELSAQRAEMPPAKDLEFHEEALVWDHRKVQALTGPVAALLEAIQHGEPPERVRALARATHESFEGVGDRQHLRDPEELVRELAEDMKARRAGRAIYPFGLRGLDHFEDDAPEKGARRIIPGASPGTMTVITGVPGTGKSTLTAILALMLARQRRRVLYGAWEMSDRTTLEMLACMSLGLRRTDLKEGKFDEETIEKVREAARRISRYVRFLANPFRRRSGERPSNDRNLDVVAGYVADSGCDVFIADLWKRCLARADPEDEEEALCRQQAICLELQVHGILVQQQRSKDVEQRRDRRPTREGIKGSGAWTEVPDNILGVHQPALWKAMPMTSLEVIVLKQRYARWPLAVEFDFDPDRGMVTGGRSIPYEMTVQDRSESSLDGAIGAAPPRRRKEWKR